MTLGAAEQWALPTLRAEAEARMLDTFSAHAPDGKITGPDGFEVPNYADKGDTRGRIAGSSMASRDTSVRTVIVGGIERPIVEGGLHIPIGAPVPKMGEYGFGWEYVLTELGPLSDPSLLNSRWLVIDAPAKSTATARRLNVIRLA